MLMQSMLRPAGAKPALGGGEMRWILFVLMTWWGMLSGEIRSPDGRTNHYTPAAAYSEEAPTPPPQAGDWDTGPGIDPEG